MADFAADAGLDAALDWYNDCDEQHVCSQQPLTYADVATYSLGKATMIAGDFTKSDNSPDGRKSTVASKTFTASATGTGTHIALIKTGDTTLRRVTTCTSISITSGTGYTMQSWSFAIRDVVGI